MKHDILRLLASITLFIQLGLAVAAQSTSNTLDSTKQDSIATLAIKQFVDRPEPAHAWSHIGSHKNAYGTIHQLRVTSQVWNDKKWEHAVEVYEPIQTTHREHALLFVTGGSQLGEPSRSEIERGLTLANQCGAAVIMLHQVPNQPLLDGRKEDDLISETWLRYLETGDPNWPLLFPMVKSAVKTLDSIETFSEKHLGNKIDKFVITGASKRGWTSWLTPVVDTRIIATAPIVIDVLNFREQMKHQLDSWGEYSLQIRDYTSKGLVKGVQEIESPRETQLRTMMDPFSYRDQLSLPKLLIVGTNDPYWTVDAMNLYWDDLIGPKFISQHPNAGHGLEGSQKQAMQTLAVFFQHVAANRPLPEIDWKPIETASTIGLQITCDMKPREVKLWYANSEDGDFRDDRWNYIQSTLSNGQWLGQIKKNAVGQQAVFAEIQFSTDDLTWSLTSLVHRFK